MGKSAKCMGYIYAIGLAFAGIGINSPAYAQNASYAQIPDLICNSKHETVDVILKNAKAGIAKYQSCASAMYYFGKGVPQNYPEAIKWYKLAADQGDAEAQNNLGNRYSLGQGVPQNYRLAYMWANIAAASSDSETAKTASEIRDISAKHLTPTELILAQQMAQKCLESNYKNCE